MDPDGHIFRKAPIWSDLQLFEAFKLPKNLSG